MPKIETLLEKEKFRKSSFRPWNFLEGLEELEAKAELEETNGNRDKIKGEPEQSKGNLNAIKREPQPNQKGTKEELKGELSRSKGNLNAIKGELVSDQAELRIKLDSKKRVKGEPELAVPLLDPSVPLL
ncbi:MAG: hypothetical protein WCK49_10380, partial [Myxococcaceae bacterium]